MTEKELKKLNRRELLEMLISKTTQNEKLLAEIDRLKSELESKEISIQTSGTLAEASIKLTKLFEEADKAVNLYVKNAALHNGIEGDIDICPATLPDGAAAQEAEPEEMLSDDTEVEDTEAEDTEAEDTEAEDTEAEDTEAEDTEAEDTELEDTEAEDEAEELDEETRIRNAVYERLNKIRLSIRESENNQ